MERVHALGNVYSRPAAPLSLSVTHGDSRGSYAAALFYKRCEATIALIFSTVRRYSAYKHTLVPIMASVRDESEGWGGNPFLRYCHPQGHWMNGRLVHLSRTCHVGRTPGDSNPRAFGWKSIGAVQPSTIFNLLNVLWVINLLNAW